MSESKEDRPNTEHVDIEVRLSTKRKNRRAAMVSRLANMPLSEFKASQLADLLLVHDEMAIWDARSDNLSKALDRLEKFLDERSALGKPSLPG